MTKTNQLDLFDQFTAHLRDLTQSKGSDYAGAEDVLSNFKIAGNLMGISPSQQCLSMICTKVARLTALLRDGQPPKNESIQDSCLDAANYFFLLAMLEFERQEHSPFVTSQLPFPDGTVGKRTVEQGYLTGDIPVEVPDDKVEYAPDYISPQPSTTCWKSSGSVVRDCLRFADTQRDGDNHFKVKVIPKSNGREMFEVTVCTLDIQDCYESVRSRFGDVEYHLPNRLDFRASSDHPGVFAITTDEVVIGGWPFRLVRYDSVTDFLWSGDIPEKEF
jgi:hypothetical protein